MKDAHRLFGGVMAVACVLPGDDVGQRRTPLAGDGDERPLRDKKYLQKDTEHVNPHADSNRRQQTQTQQITLKRERL